MQIIENKGSAMNRAALNIQSNGWTAFGAGPWGNSRTVYFIRFEKDGQHRLLVGSDKRIKFDRIS